MSDFGEMKTVKVRKDCKCSWCGELILKGQSVSRFKGNWQGDWQNWKMHDECLDYYTKEDDMDEGFTPFHNERPKSGEKK